MANPLSFVPILGDFIGGDEKQKVLQKQADRIGALNNELYGNMYAPDTRVQDSAEAYAAADPEAIDAQRTALRGLKDLYSQGGLGLQDRQALSQLQWQQAQQNQGQQQSILNRARNRGMQTGGATLVSQLLAGQNAANQAQQQGLGVLAMGQDRRMNALNSYAGLGSNMRSQSFGEADTRARARDYLNRFNADQLNNRFANQMQLNQAKQGLALQQITGQTQAGMAPVEGASAARKFTADTIAQAIQAGKKASGGV